MQEKKYENIKDCLAAVAAKRRVEKPKVKDITSLKRRAFYVLNKRILLEHNCKPCFVTITFPKYDGDILQEWSSMKYFLEGLKKGISKYYLCVGGVIAIEPHRNSTLYSKRGKNTKSGRPHIHAVLWFMHDFLNPDFQYIDFALSYGNMNAKVQVLRSNRDLISSAMYTIKEIDNIDLLKVCQQTLNWHNNCAVWINHRECANLFFYLHQQLFSNSILFEDYYITTPSTPQWRDDQIFLAQLFSKLFMKKGLAVKDNDIYKRVTGTRYTWQFFMPLNEWIANQFILDLPVLYLRKLKESLSWLINAGAKRKGDPSFHVFPTISPWYYFIEFADCVYTFDTAKTIPFEDVSPNTDSVCSEPYKFHETPLPLRLIYLLYILISLGRDSAKKFHETKQILQKHNFIDTSFYSLPVGEIRKVRMQYDKFNEKHQFFLNALETFGGLYHPKENRKKNRVLYLQGPTNTFKTFLVKTILGKLVGIHNIDFISRHSSRFNTAHLKKNNDLPYVLIIDDFRWQSYGMSTGEFLNFLDGEFVHTEQKFGKAQTGTLKGTIAITSNHSIAEGPNGQLESFSKQDVDALRSRIHEIPLHSLSAPKFEQLPPTFWNDIEQEAVAFSMLSNAYFLSRNNKFIENIVLPNSFFQELENLEPYQKTSFQLLQEILKDIYK